MIPKGTLKLHHVIMEVMASERLWNDSLESDLPRGWHTYDDLILFPSQAFAQENWKQCGQTLWKAIGQHLKVSRLARVKGPVRPEYRRPNIEILLEGNGSTMVSKTENGIRYGWDLLKCMYSPGNTTEKLRIAKFDCRNQVVVDMFAGIGYFSLPYLLKAKAKKVFAIDWNPDALDALARNVVRLKCQERCVIIAGDNRRVTPEGIADHVNLGYIPSCDDSLEAGCKALNRHHGGILHIHGNCDIKSSKGDVGQGDMGSHAWAQQYHNTWSTQIQAKVNNILLLIDVEMNWKTEIVSIFKIKSFGPRVDHLVVDILCKPENNEGP